jgi:pimeloyl-ACP methyl ester carboxylesterase
MAFVVPALDSCISSASHVPNYSLCLPDQSRRVQLATHLSITDRRHGKLPLFKSDLSPTMADHRSSAIETKMPKTVKVPHLGGIDVSYRMPKPYRQYKPTVVLINSFSATAEVYREQFANEKLTDVMNLVAIEPLGHGDTRAKVSETFTYWDSAIMAIQALDALGIKQTFVLGMSQGGWIAARMALYAPNRISGLILLSTAMDSENERTTKLGSWDGYAELTPLVTSLTSKTEVNDFEPSDDYCNYLVDNGFGKDVDADTRKLWTEIVKKNYQGDAGRKRFREAAVNVRDRDSLHSRLTNIKCPVIWLQGDQDVLFSVKIAEEEIKMFDQSPEPRLIAVKGGPHLISWTHAEEVNTALLEFVSKHSQGMKPSGRALREAVGMVEM